MDSIAKKMQSPYNETMLVDRVMDTVCEVLGCDKTELNPELSIGDELGAESLDFVEIRYNLERGLGIALPQRSVLDHLAVLAPNTPAVATNGGLTAFGAEALRSSLFGYSDKVAKEGARLNDVMQGATIRNWALLCLGILDSLPNACPDCGHHSASISRSGKPVCTSCNAALKPLSGEDVMLASTESWLLHHRESEVIAA